MCMLEKAIILRQTSYTYRHTIDKYYVMTHAVWHVVLKSMFFLLDESHAMNFRQILASNFSLNLFEFCILSLHSPIYSLTTHF